MPGVVEQIKLVAGLRWRILRNSLRRKNNRWDLVGMVWVGVFSALLVAGLSFAFFGGGYELIVKGRGSWMALLYWAIVLWWQLFPMFVAGFGSNFEFATLLRFPLSLRAFYLLGLGYGLSDYAALSAICWVVSMIAGAATANRNVVPAMLVVSLLFVLLNVTMERLVGSWLEKLLAKRRTRELVLGLFVLCMVSLNFLNPIVQKWGHGAQPRIMAIVPYLTWFPGSLAGSAVGAASRGETHGFLVGTAGLLAWAMLSSALLWRRFATQYSGEVISDSPAPAVIRKKREKRNIVSEKRPGLISPQVAAVAGKEFRYLTRNGFAFLTLILPPLMVVFFTLQFGP